MMRSTKPARVVYMMRSLPRQLPRPSPALRSTAPGDNAGQCDCLLTSGSDGSLDCWSEPDGTLVLANIDAVAMGRLAELQAVIEEDLRVWVDMRVGTVRIWDSDGDRQHARDAAELIAAMLPSLTAADARSDALPGLPPPAPYFFSNPDDEAEDVGLPTGLACGVTIAQPALGVTYDYDMDDGAEIPEVQYGSAAKN